MQSCIFQVSVFQELVGFNLMTELFQFRKCILTKLAVFTLLVSLIHVSTVEAKVRRYKWEAKHEYKSPDCYKKLVLTINGKSPGPSILAQQGDTIIVELKNSLTTENLAIHWHGIRQVHQKIKTMFVYKPMLRQGLYRH